jgi:very-short-patch-repair endonuclease
MPVNINNWTHLKYFRKKLRNNSTAAEIHLWNFLQKSQLDQVKFRRQHSIGPYIVDFYTYQYNLAIELDGQIHDEELMIQHDANRTTYLNRNGIKVLRFKNQEVFEDIERVLDKIRKEFTTPDPS